MPLFWPEVGGFVPYTSASSCSAFILASGVARARIWDSARLWIRARVS